MATVHGMAPSDYCWKAAQILRRTGAPFRRVEVDTDGGQTPTPQVLARHPFRQGARAGAGRRHGAGGIQRHPAACGRGLALAPAAGPAAHPRPGMPVLRAAQPRALHRGGAQHPRLPGQRRAERRAPGGARALDAKEHRLSSHDWRTDAGPTVAGLAPFAYTRAAEEGGFDLARWPGVQARVARVAARPGIVTLRRA